MTGQPDVGGGSVALVAVQLRLTMDDLDSAAAFGRCIERAAEGAAAAAAGADHRLLVFPEAVGHFLPLCEAPPSARAKRTVADVIAALAVRRPVSVLLGMLDAGTPGLQKAVMYSVLPRADRLMRETFAQVARRHRATVVAGSHLRARRGGRLTNSSYTFDPTGRLVASTDKINLVPMLEDASPGGLGLSRGDPDAVPVVDAGWGRVATLICYDGFREAHTHHERFAPMGDRVDAAGVDVIANPAANPWPWHERWFYAEPGEQLDRCDQWRAEGLPATLATLHRVRYGVTAHLCARLLDQRFEGRSEILERTAEGVRVLAAADSVDGDEAVVAHVPASGLGARPVGAAPPADPGEGLPRPSREVT